MATWGAEILPSVSLLLILLRNSFNLFLTEPCIDTAGEVKKGLPEMCKKGQFTIADNFGGCGGAQ